MIIKDRRFGEERALYNTHGAEIVRCRFEGEEDGESFLKESSDLKVKSCFMDLRYPFWHCKNLEMEDCEMTKNCRAALWYDENVAIRNSRMNGIKALRESESIALVNVTADSPEFCWKCRKISVEGGSILSEYAFLGSRDILVKGLKFAGKYSFQYTENLKISDSELTTKDAFWHSKNALVENCVVGGEYLGWYSEGLTLVNCLIRGTQPLCYCKNLKLVNCTMEKCDLAFEYSEVEAAVKGRIDSVKNPLRGRIEADEIGEIILSDGPYPSAAEILCKNNPVRKNG